MPEETYDFLDNGLVLPSLPRIDSASESGDVDHDSTQSNEDAEDLKSNPNPNANRYSTDETHAYDLRPPPPVGVFSDAEYLADRLFSPDHLNIILKDSTHLQRFTAFLLRHRPLSVPTLVRYLDSQKAIKAIQYANALADQISQPLLPQKPKAATIDPTFARLSQQALEDLVKEALPLYITHGLVDIVTELVDKEIVGRHPPLPHQAIQALAEVYCISDPTQPDNPIVFASEEFFTTTQYGSNYTIGRNCRFLQGPKTSKTATERIKIAIEERRETSEVVLNYRRDGSPFFNLMMVAPLKDNRGVVRYYIGCQIDVTQIIEDGKGIDTFRQLLAKDQSKSTESAQDPLEYRPSLKILREFGSLLGNEEVEAVRDGDKFRVESRPSSPRSSNQPRRFVGPDDCMPADMLRSKDLTQIPGVYQNYILVRPYPSLRIIFTSPSLRVPGLCQSRLEDHIGGSEHVRDSLVDALAQGIGVTAKVSWLSLVPKQSNMHLSVPSIEDNASYVTTDSHLPEGKPRWIHCTPLLGSDSKVGVIMIVIVDAGKHDPSSFTNAPNASTILPATTSSTIMSRGGSRSRLSMRSVDYSKEHWPLQSSGLNSASSRVPLTSPPIPQTVSGSSKLYAEYLRKEVLGAAQQRTDNSRDRPKEGGVPSSRLGYTATIRAAQEEVQSSVPRRMLSKVKKKGGGSF